MVAQQRGPDAPPLSRITYIFQFRGVGVGTGQKSKSMSNDIYVCVNQTGRWRLKYCIPYTWPSIACCYDGRMVNQYPGSQLVCYIKYNTHLQCHHRFRGYRIFWGQRVAILSLIIPAYSSLSRYQGSSSHLQPVASFVYFGGRHGRSTVAQTVAPRG